MIDTTSSPQSYETIAVEVADGVATITLNRPKVLNALSAELIRELHAALDVLERDPWLRAVILTGSGEKAFAAGADIGELAALASAPDGAAQARKGQAITRRVETFRVPVIVAVNGFALGGGCELAMSGDIRIASENAKFGQPEVNLGLIPGYGGTQRMTRLVGRGDAMYLCLTGEMIDAATALRLGLVQKVVPLYELMDEARRIAALIAAKAPLAVAATKRAIDEGAAVGITEALAIEAAHFGLMFGTEDVREGTSAFLEKRKAAFTGR
jgi:enoyl-CoA hydratase